MYSSRRRSRWGPSPGTVIYRDVSLIAHSSSMISLAVAGCSRDLGQYLTRLVLRHRGVGRVVTQLAR